MIWKKVNVYGLKSPRGRPKLVTEHILLLGLKQAGVMELYLLAPGSLHGLKVPMPGGGNENNSAQEEGTHLMNYKNLKYTVSMQLFKCLLNRDVFSDMEICASCIFKS